MDGCAQAPLNGVAKLLGALTCACLSLACDAADRPIPQARVLPRAFPETADFRDEARAAAAGSVPAESAKPAPLTAPATAAPAAGVSLAAPPATLAPAPSRGGERVAAVLLMLPDDAAGAGSKGTRTYKVSLGPDLGDARVEINGRDMGALPVQRVYPQQRVASPARPMLPGMPIAVSRPAGVDGTLPPLRPARRAVTETMPTTQLGIMNPNGAPIID